MFFRLWNNDWEKHAGPEQPCDSTHLTETTDDMCCRKEHNSFFFSHRSSRRQCWARLGDVCSEMQVKDQERPKQCVGMGVRALCSMPSAAERALASVSQSIKQIISTSSGKGLDLLDRKHSLITWYYYLALNVPVCSANFHLAEMNELQ